MPNANQDKGKRAERAVVAASRLRGFARAERSKAGRFHDDGDIAHMPGLVVQVKDVASKSWGPWFSDLTNQVFNAGADHGVLVVKRRGVADAGQWLAVMTYDRWLALVRDAGYGYSKVEEEMV